MQRLMQCMRHGISIHALLAESDHSSHVLPMIVTSISIHALLAESDPVGNRKPVQRRGFLSTLSLRRATVIVGFLFLVLIHFYPRSPCGERRSIDLIRVVSISFLSTLSLRRATADLHAFHGHMHHFYPRSPCGERRQHNSLSGRVIPFLSTLSLRRATITTFIM